MTDDVKNLLEGLMAKDFLGYAEETAVLQRILANGVASLSEDEIAVFAEAILPAIKKHNCDCWSCHTDVSGNSADDIYEFLATGLCPVCNETDFIRDAASL